jgi:DNA modification methylase
MSVFYQGDSLHLLKTQISDKSINLLYINPPFGTTRQPWDEALPWSEYFAEFFRVLKDDGMLVIHCSVPFNYELIRCAPKAPLYSWYWLKERPTCPLIANSQPLRQIEEILVWKKKKTTYYRQQIGTEERQSSWMVLNNYYGKNVTPKKTIIKGKTRSHFLPMKREVDGFATRPKELVKLMIDSYTKEGDTILDCFCYKGLSYTQSKGRKWIGFDKYFFPTYFVTEASPQP